MAGDKGGKNTKHGRNRGSIQNANYKAQGRLERNKKRNIRRDATRQAEDADKRLWRTCLRKKGAVMRLQRRIKEAHAADKPTGKLYEALTKAEHALDRAWPLSAVVSFGEGHESVEA